jgi:hypothetical protein
MTTKLNSLWVILILTIPFYPGTQITNEKHLAIYYMLEGAVQQISLLFRALVTLLEKETRYLSMMIPPHTEKTSSSILHLHGLGRIKRQHG